ncbi:hypothetical protein GGR33_000220 [Methylobacterium brachythecii]|uniref:Uncharacterized protein n=2 Tax=Methylobacterium brachythecii TaxID=1176177 RepID=A0A7W6F4U1_9HYPH|nr:hypothetical protein [Methylobacterium brachythecii]MBB3900740.1 hypothetical protein [Methylobacterium brachythecii]
MAAIAQQTGVPPTTVKLWNRQARIRPRTRAPQFEANPRNWTKRRVSAAARLLGRGDLDPGDLAEAMGVKRDDAGILMLACGLTAVQALPTQAPGTPDLADLNAALRGHIARQIVALDDRLHKAGPADDTARLLRDVGGLKRLLDDLSTPRPLDAVGDTDGEPLPDLAALRADLARRYEAFAAGGHPAGLPGEPAAGAPGGARP